MTITPRTKFYIGLAVSALFTIGIIGSSALSHSKISALEKAVEAARADAIGKQQRAMHKEIEAAAYKQKIDYLEGKFAEIKTIAREQDEQMQKLNNNSRGARGDVERARRTRAITTTAAELCAKLAEIGHACR